MPPIQALIFDMDGVLVDTEPLHLRAYQEALAGFGVNFSENENREFLGRTDLDLSKIIVARKALKAEPSELVDRKEEIFFSLIADKLLLRPGVLRTLIEAKSHDLKIAVASSALLSTIRKIVSSAEISAYFDAIASGEEVSHGKPAPDVFLLAASRLGVAPESCLVIEDSLNGVLAAKAAGMRCVAVPCDATAHQDHSPADLKLDSLECLELASLLYSA